MESNFKRIKTCVVFVALLVSLSLTVLAYARIVEIEKPKFTYFEDYLELGEKNFSILSHDKCIGEINIHTHKERATFVNIFASLRSSYQDKPINTTIKSQFYFNPLGQLSESTLNITTSNLELHAQSNSINPIGFLVDIKGIGTEKTFNFDFDGPLLIQEYEPGKMRIEYSHQLQISNPVFDGPITYLKSQNGLEILEGKVEQVCQQKESVEQLPLDSIIKSLSKFSFNEISS